MNLRKIQLILAYMIFIIAAITLVYFFILKNEVIAIILQLINLVFMLLLEFVNSKMRKLENKK